MRCLKNCLRELREDVGITQNELAKQSGNARDLISRIERDKIKSPSYYALFSIAEYFGKPVDTIFWYEEEK